MKALAKLAACAASFALAGCNEQAAIRPPVNPTATVVGEAQNCIPLGQLRESRVRDDWTIDFIGSGGRVWRNALSSRCPGLRPRSAIGYETAIGQLCSTDIVYVLESAGGLHRGAACGLGQFLPVKLEGTN